MFLYENVLLGIGIDYILMTIPHWVPCFYCDQPCPRWYFTT